MTKHTIRNRSLRLLSRVPPRNRNPHFPRHHYPHQRLNPRLLNGSYSHFSLQIHPDLYLEHSRDIHWMMSLTRYRQGRAITAMTRTRSLLESLYVSRSVKIAGPSSRRGSHNAKSSCLGRRARNAEELPMTSRTLTSTKVVTHRR